jgi:hypothetical protein
MGLKLEKECKKAKKLTKMALLHDEEELLV